MNEELMRRTNEAATEAAESLDDIVRGIERMLEGRLGDKTAAKMAIFKAIESCLTLHIWRNVRQEAYAQIVAAMTEMIREKLDAAIQMESKINTLTPTDRRPN